MKNVKISQSCLNIFYIFVGFKRNSFFNLFIDQIRGCFDQHNIKIAQLKHILLAVQRRLDSGLQSIMVNERLVTRGFSLMRLRREHLRETQDGAFERVGL